MENVNLKKSDDKIIIEVESRPIAATTTTEQKPKTEADVISEWFRNQTKNFNGSDPNEPFLKK